MSEQTSYRDNNSGGNGGGYFSKILRRFSSYNMNIDDMVVRNTRGLPKGASTSLKQGVDNFYDLVAINALSKTLQEKSISYFDKSYLEKSRVLREYARKDEIRDYISIIADETIMYDEKENFAEPIDLPSTYNDETRKKYNDNFKSIFRLLGFKNGRVAWDLIRTLLTDGYVAFEIIFDDKDKNVIGFNSLEPTTLLPTIDPITRDPIWVQFADNAANRRVMLDSQIIYVSYSSGVEFTEVSYVEGLIRPYNQLKLLEQTKIMFNLMNAQVNRVTTIPVVGMGRAVAEQQIAKMIMDIKDEVTFDASSGLPIMNGLPHIQYNKDIFLTEGESGTPKIENLKFEGHNLNENDMLTWFYNALKRTSKIPFTRFDKTNGGGSVFGGSDSDISRDEMSFHFFIQRLRNIFKEILIKPWKIQMCLDFPEILDDENFMDAINIRFTSVNAFHETKRMINIHKRMEIITTMKGVTRKQKNPTSGEIEEVPFFSTEWLLREYGNFSDDELNENERYLNIELKKNQAIGGSIEPGAGGDMGGGGSSGGDMGGGFEAPAYSPPEPASELASTIAPEAETTTPEPTEGEGA
jgi:hypothetical protein